MFKNTLCVTLVECETWTKSLEKPKLSTFRRKHAIISCFSGWTFSWVFNLLWTHAYMHSHQTSFNNIILEFNLTFHFNGRFDKRKLWYIYTMEYYSAIKKNTFEAVLMRWIKQEPIIQSEESQKEKHQYSILTHIYGI